MIFTIDITKYVQKSYIVKGFELTETLNVTLPLYSFEYNELRQLMFVLKRMDSELLFYLDSTLYEVDDVWIRKFEDKTVVADVTFKESVIAKTFNEQDYIPSHDFEMVLIDGGTVLNLSTFHIETSNCDNDILYRINSIRHCGYHFL